MPNRMSAEFLGTAWLVFGGCGSAVLAAGFPQLGIGFLGVALAFGLSVLTMAYAVGHVSGGHFNPAVTVGLWAGGRFPAREIVPYALAQVLGAIAGAGVLTDRHGQAGLRCTPVAASTAHEPHPGLLALRAFRGDGADLFVSVILEPLTGARPPASRPSRSGCA